MERVDPDDLVVGKDYYIELNLPSERETFMGFDEKGRSIFSVQNHSYNRNSYNYYDVKTNELVNHDDLIVGNRYIVKKKSRRIGTYKSRYFRNFIIENERKPDGTPINKDPRLSELSYAYSANDYIFYNVNKPDIINNFEKKAYEDVLLNNLSREDTRTGERVHESLGPEVIDSIKMFGGKKRQRKSKRRKSYRRKSRKCKR